MYIKTSLASFPSHIKVMLMRRFGNDKSKEDGRTILYFISTASVGRSEHIRNSVRVLSWLWQCLELPSLMGPQFKAKMEIWLQLLATAPRAESSVREGDSLVLESYLPWLQGLCCAHSFIALSNKAVQVRFVWCTLDTLRIRVCLEVD